METLATRQKRLRDAVISSAIATGGFATAGAIIGDITSKAGAAFGAVFFGFFGAIALWSNLDAYLETRKLLRAEKESDQSGIPRFLRNVK